MENLLAAGAHSMMTSADIIGSYIELLVCSNNGLCCQTHGVHDGCYADYAHIWQTVPPVH